MRIGTQRCAMPTQTTVSRHRSFRQPYYPKKARMSKGSCAAFVDPVPVSVCNHEPEEHLGAVRQGLVNH
jgi:hypothetical protein